MKRGTIIATALALLSAVTACAGKGSQPSSSAEASPKPSQETFSGPAIAEDGDTVIINDRFIDLWGVEAPNLDNSDGWYSRAALDRLIGENGQLVCIIKVKRKKHRDLAVCSNNRVGDVGRAMLKSGWAVVNRRDKRDRDVDTALTGVYERTEQRAREARAGLWANYPLK